MVFLFLTSNYLEIAHSAAPVVEASATPLRQFLGGSVTLLCSVISANPTVSMYSWFRNSVLLSSGPDPSYDIAIVVQDDFSAVFLCDAYNGIGNGSSNITIEVGCK